MNKDAEDRIWLLVSKKLADESDQTELNELTALLDEYPKINDIVKQLFDWWIDDSKEKMDDKSHFLFQNIVNRI